MNASRYAAGSSRFRAWWLLWLFVLPLGARGAALPDPQGFVRGVTDRVLEVIRTHREEFRNDLPALHRAIEVEVVPNFDIRTMSRWVLGKYWRRLGREDRARFVRNFEHLLIRTYSTALLEYRDQRIDYLPLRWDGKSPRAVVRTRIVPKAGEAIPVDYTLRWKDGAWRVVDVKIDGVSLVANYRSTFGTEIRSRGIQALLARLEQRVQENTQRDRDRSGGGGGDTDAGG